MKLVGFTGVSRSGKSTAATLFAGGDGPVFAFSKPFKRMLIDLYDQVGLSRDEITARIEGPLKDTPDPLFHDKTPRDMMIWLGQSGRQQVHRDIWVDVTRHKILKMAASKRVAVNDVRQESEAAMIRNLGGSIVLIYGRGKHSGDQTDDEIPSDLIDYTIRNDGSIDDLKDKIKSLLG